MYVRVRRSAQAQNCAVDNSIEKNVGHYIASHQPPSSRIHQEKEKEDALHRFRRDGETYSGDGDYVTKHQNKVSKFVQRLTHSSRPQNARSARSSQLRCSDSQYRHSVHPKRLRYYITGAANFSERASIASKCQSLNAERYWSQQELP